MVQGLGTRGQGPWSVVHAYLVGSMTTLGTCPPPSVPSPQAKPSTPIGLSKCFCLANMGWEPRVQRPYGPGNPRARGLSWNPKKRMSRPWPRPPLFGSHMPIAGHGPGRHGFNCYYWIGVWGGGWGWRPPPLPRAEPSSSIGGGGWVGPLVLTGLAQLFAQMIQFPVQCQFFVDVWELFEVIVGA